MPVKTNAGEYLKIRTISVEDAPEDWEPMINGLKILARMIARVYLEERSRYRQELNKVSTSAVIDKTTLAGLQSGGRLTLTVMEAAEFLGLSRGSTYSAIRTGKIPSIRIGRRIIVPKASLISILSEVHNFKTDSR